MKNMSILSLFSLLALLATQASAGVQTVPGPLLGAGVAGLGAFAVAGVAYLVFKNKDKK